MDRKHVNNIWVYIWVQHKGKRWWIRPAEFGNPPTAKLAMESLHLFIVQIHKSSDQESETRFSVISLGYKLWKTEAYAWWISQVQATTLLRQIKYRWDLMWLHGRTLSRAEIGYVGHEPFNIDIPKWSNSNTVDLDSSLSKSSMLTGWVWTSWRLLSWSTQKTAFSLQEISKSRL